MIGYRMRASTSLHPFFNMFWNGLGADKGWCSLFGRKRSPYDFAAVDIGHLKEKARELDDMRKGMKVNPKVINMIDR